MEASSMVLESLLRALWIAFMLPFLASSIPFFKINAFRHYAHLLTSRGKIMDSSLRKFSVPQKYFSHFYIVGVIWNSILLVATLVHAYKSSSVGEYKYGIWKSVFLLLLMEAQLLRRLIESIFIFNYSPSARMHIATYLTGLLYYIAVLLSLCCKYSAEALKFGDNNNFVEGKGKDRMQEFNFWGYVTPLLQLEWYAWIGAAFLFWGWIHQDRCHFILGSIRKNGGKVYEYAIPEGDWFECVSSPHYLAEIVIYGGLMIASGFSDITIWLLFVFVVANLTFSAGETHRWYLAKFDNYPRNRYAIIPFIY